ncbi:hypothetical protein OAH18_00240 [bacterium]|nr:hypothetical protein [bacterium]
MAEMTIRLQTDPATGKKNIIVSLSLEEDMLPHEHEDQHRQLVEKLIEGGVIKASELGKVIVEREEEKNIPAENPPEDQQQRESTSEGA